MQGGGGNSNIKIGIYSVARVEQFKYLRATLTNRNFIHEEIKSRLNLGSTCCHSVQNFCLPVYYTKCKD
jgi:hypothetical protein